MAKVKVGDKVRIKGRTEWPLPPGYRFANAEGTVVKWVEYDEAMEEFNDFVYVHIEKAQGEGQVYVGNNMLFRAENVDKI
jgi:hypothetical protein